MPSHQAQLHYLDSEMEVLWREVGDGSVARCPAGATEWPARALGARGPCRASVRGTGGYTHLLYTALRAEAKTEAAAAAAAAEPFADGGLLMSKVAASDAVEDNLPLEACVPARQKACVSAPRRTPPPPLPRPGTTEGAVP